MSTAVPVAASRAISRHPFLKSGLAALMVALAWSGAVQAGTVSGSYSYLLTNDEMRFGHTVDLGAFLQGSTLQFTRVRATFSAGIVSDMYTAGQLPAQYTLTSSYKVVSTPPHCDGWTGWCSAERDTYEGTAYTLMTQSDMAQMQVSIGGTSGSDGTKGTLTESMDVYNGTQHTEMNTSFVDHTDPSSPGLVDIRRSYFTTYYTRMVWSSKTRLEVSLDLDAATLAAMSSSGLLHFNAMSTLIWEPTLQLDYEGVSTAVPEPGSAALAGAGVVMAGIAARRRRAASRAA